MFKVAATKFAHSATIPIALAGNPDLRPLQDLITAEKNVLTSLQRLGTDVNKAADALRLWGEGEGEDLEDVLRQSATILSLYAESLMQYSTLGHEMREHLKAIRTREENLDELKRRKKSLMTKAESSGKKLSRLPPEHKNLQSQIEILDGLRAEIHSLEAEILSNESSLRDFKRSTTKTWMGLKFGGLLECSQKGDIAGEYGKLVIAEIPEENVEAGSAGKGYYGQRTTEDLVSEARRSISQVIRSTSPTLIVPRSSQDSAQDVFNDNMWSSDNPILSNSGTSTYPLPDPSYPTATPSPNNHSLPATGSKFGQSVDDFGINISGPGSTAHPAKSSNFATFPHKRHVETAPPQLSLDLGSSADEPLGTGVAKVLLSSQGSTGPPLGLSMPNRQFISLSAPAGRNLEGENPVQGETLAYLDDSQQQWENFDQQRHSIHEGDATTSHVRYAGEANQEVLVEERYMSGPPPEYRIQSDAFGTMSQATENNPYIGDSLQVHSQQSRIPPPPFNPAEESNERLRNAAAAREVGRELEALGKQQPSLDSVGTGLRGPHGHEHDGWVDRSLSQLGAQGRDQVSLPLLGHGTRSTPGSAGAGEWLLPTNRSASASVTSLVSSGSQGARTISAAAFKRPHRTGTGESIGGTGVWRRDQSPGRSPGLTKQSLVGMQTTPSGPGYAPFGIESENFEYEGLDHSEGYTQGRYATNIEAGSLR